MSNALDFEIERQSADGGYLVKPMDTLDNRGRRPVISIASSRGSVVETLRVGERPSKKVKGPDDGEKLD